MHPFYFCGENGKQQPYAIPKIKGRAYKGV